MPPFMRGTLYGPRVTCAANPPCGAGECGTGGGRRMKAPRLGLRVPLILNKEVPSTAIIKNPLAYM